MSNRGIGRTAAVMALTMAAGCGMGQTGYDAKSDSVDDTQRIASESTLTLAFNRVSVRREWNGATAPAGYWLVIVYLQVKVAGAETRCQDWGVDLMEVTDDTGAYPAQNTGHWCAPASLEAVFELPDNSPQNKTLTLHLHDGDPVSIPLSLSL